MKGTVADPIQPLTAILPGFEEKPGGIPTLGVQKIRNIQLATLTAASTTYKVLGFICPSDGWYVKELWVGAVVVPSYASTVLAVEKYDASATSAKNVLSTTNVSVQGLTAKIGTKLTVTTTLDSLIMDEGDTLWFTLTVGATESTAGEGLAVTVVLVGPEID